MSNAIEIANDMMGQLSGLRDYSIEDSFIIEGFTKKYYDSRNPIDHERLSREAISQWLQYDADLKWKVHNDMWAIRDRLRHWLKGFKPSRKVELSPGEHEIASRGHTSVEAKLCGPWSVTAEAFPDFAKLVFNTHHLRKAAWRKINKGLKWTKNQRLLFWKRVKAFYPKATMYQRLFIYFKALLKKVVQFVWGSRLTTVPKNIHKRRVINIEPFGNILCQRTVAHTLREILAYLGNDLKAGQLVHRIRISSSWVATIDFSNASDSILLALVQWLFPREVVQYLMNYRSSMVLIDGEYHIPNKISAMGNGFTFEIMTLILLAVARQYDDKATVYGDDVVINNDSAQSFIEVCEAMGFTVNREKSFVHSPVRESCGAFYSDNTGEIVRYDFKAIENVQDIILHANKAREIALHAKSPIIGNLFASYYDRLCSVVPRQLQGPEPRGHGPLELMWTKWGFRLAPSHDSLCRVGMENEVHLFKQTDMLEDRYLINDQYTYERYSDDYHTRWRWQYVVGHSGRKRSSTLREVDPFHNYGKLAMYMYGLRVSDDLIRGQDSIRVRRMRLYA
uniref:RNA-directed RNA polymerase n=1 Tax=Marr virus TaxID=2707240 RepID=A0A6H0DI66_9VIRU|nr:MAG: RNA-dependent RNA polymerase [Marr virus]